MNTFKHTLLATSLIEGFDETVFDKLREVDFSLDVYFAKIFKRKVVDYKMIEDIMRCTKGLPISLYVVRQEGYQGIYLN